MDARIDALMAALALPEVGLSTVFFIAFVAATLIPLASEPAVSALVKLNPEMFWPAIVVWTSAPRSAARSPGGWATAPSAPTST